MEREFSVCFVPLAVCVHGLHLQWGEVTSDGRRSDQSGRTQHLLRWVAVLFCGVRGAGRAKPLLRRNHVDRRGRTDRLRHARQAGVGGARLHRLPHAARRGRLLRARTRQRLGPLRRQGRPAGRARGAEGLDPVDADRDRGPAADAATSSSPTRSSTISRASSSGSARSTRRAGRRTRPAEQSPGRRRHDALPDPEDRLHLLRRCHGAVPGADPVRRARRHWSMSCRTSCPSCCRSTSSA